MSHFYIKAIRGPNATQEIKLPEGTTFQKFLTIMEWELRENEVATVNALIASPNQILKEGDVVILGVGARGEFTVKRDGIWRLHMNDLDPWPSNPHAHNQENKREVLNLETGEIFDKRRKYLRKLSDKDLLYIREQFGLDDEENAA